MSYLYVDALDEKKFLISMEQPIELKCHKRLLARMRFFFTPADQQDRKPVNACDDQDGNGKK